jgi:hypothetical protein
MRGHFSRTVCLLLCSMAVACVMAIAQGPPPGGSPGVGPGKPSMGPGGPGNPGQPGPARGADNGNPTGAQRNALQFGPVGRWWDNKAVVQQVGLRKDQQKKMDQIFDSNKPAILSSYKSFLKAQSNLAAVNKDTNADQTKVFAAIDAVNGARGDLQKATSAMLLEIRKEMDPSQIDKLAKIQ